MKEKEINRPLKYNQILKFYIDKLNIIFTSIIGEIDSIILVGSYATKKGEFDNQGKPLSDFDYYIIVKTKLTKAKINKWLNSIENLIREVDYCIEIDLHFLNRKNLSKLMPFFRFYDLKYNSKVTWGNDVRNIIPNFTSEDISKYDGLRYIATILLYILEGKKITNKKLDFVKKNVEKIAIGKYGEPIESDKIDLDNFVEFALDYYHMALKGASKKHLIPTLNYLLKTRLMFSIPQVFVKIISFSLQIYWTFKWMVKNRNLKVLVSYKDPALRIFYSIIYYFSSKHDLQSIKLFNSMSKKSFSKEELICLHNSYFLKNKLNTKRTIVKTKNG